MGLSLPFADGVEWQSFSSHAEEMSTRLLLEDAIHGFFHNDIALVSSFGAEAAVLLHLVAQIDRSVPVIFLDTGKLFGETLRYRDAQGEIEIKTDSAGKFSVTWPSPGMYWLEATLEDNKTSIPQAKLRRVSYAATFEVLPSAPLPTLMFALFPLTLSGAPAASKTYTVPSP